MSETKRGQAAKQADRWRRAKERDEWARWAHAEELAGPRVRTPIEEYLNGAAASINASFAPLRDAFQAGLLRDAPVAPRPFQDAPD